MAGKIHIGTSGWHYKGWRGEYYPEKMKPADWLQFYLKDFKTTEINNSFYMLPKKETVEKWAAKVPASFHFSPKFSRYLTHMKKLNDPEEPFERFFSVFEAMGKKLGVVLLQLPPQLGYNEIKARHVYELIKHQYKKYRFAIEVRHHSWTCKESIKLMEEYKIAFTISQQGVGWPYAEHITSKDIYVRFHGPKKLFASAYSDEQLKDYAKKFKRWAKEGHTVWAYFNNDVYVDAIYNAKTLIEYCE
jgi:uncharacterized protein YecE (DUF72 family)